MRRFLTMLAMVLAVMNVEAEGTSYYDDGEFGYEDWTVGAGATLTLPQGGGRMRRLGGAALRVGRYVDDAWALEATVAWQEDVVALGMHGLWHWWLFERFDPFFTVGVDGWIDGGVGPSLGWGCFWHFNDNWSLRTDATATLDLDGAREAIYTLAIGLQYAF